ncbi:2,3-diketo-5-methylthiopentyl-1-phosphate enolase [Alicyclobacillus sp.]|uniref:2,3-diketo-5-methylthiopentyl-1-phosphate enolase n=1 Tax=Alicyclobacillus sp. TaxID=61169 RepID=UPI0025C122CF|nr:2,3-diketo-5-methylthiopentyl-1-phosphate enolase [Alicyclobacillus sp.]MCL6517227.1 2,3-diketo-5-methylthiopentyl-1-phosphate enolase [Alicyclobacillus sp.]
MADERFVLATYELEDEEKALKKRADGIAVGLTVGSWTDLPAAQQERMQPYCGRVEDITVLERLGEGRVRARITIGYPVVNFPARIPALLTTVFGKLSMDGRIRLVRLELPPAFVGAFPGPKFGAAGVREILGVQGRPLLMSIFKSCIGMPLDALVAAFTEQALGGADLIKDDEIFFNESIAPPEARVQAYRDAARRTEEETGQKVLYAVNLTGPVTQLRDRARRLSELGAGALLINAFAYGLDVVQALAEDPEVTVPLMAHPAVAGAMYAAPGYGISAAILFGQLLRLAGADIVIYPSPYGTVTLEANEGREVLGHLREDNGLKPALPAPSAGIHPGLVPLLVRDYGVDVIVNAGGGIHGHPGGARAGGRAFVAAIRAVMDRRPLAEAAGESPELAAAIEKWGVKEA